MSASTSSNPNLTYPLSLFSMLTVFSAGKRSSSPRTFVICFSCFFVSFSTTLQFTSLCPRGTLIRFTFLNIVSFAISSLVCTVLASSITHPPSRASPCNCTSCTSEKNSLSGSVDSTTFQKSSCSKLHVSSKVRSTLLLPSPLSKSASGISPQITPLFRNSVGITRAIYAKALVARLPAR